MYLLNNIIFKIISTLVIFLISIIYPTSSKTNDGSFELSMDCTDKNKIFKSYIKKETKICFIENNNKEVCNTFSSNDSSLFQYVIEYDNTIEIIDFSNLNVSVSSQNNFSKLKCKNFKKNSKVVNNNSYKITENYESNKNLNLKELEGTEKNRDFTIDSIINFEKKFYNSLSSRNFSYFPEDFLEIKKLRNEISSNLQQRNVKKTSTKIKSLFNKLITLEKKIDNQYLNSLSNAKSNYQNLAYYKAKENINLALQLKPQSSEALKLESLINKLPKKLKILENLKISRKENNKLKELFFLKELDSIENSKTIKNQILGLENELKLNNFEDLMSQSENFLKEKNIKINNLKLSDQALSFTVENDFKEEITKIFTNEDSQINPYYPRFKSHELDLLEEENTFILRYSKQGLVKLKTSSQDQALEIIRRRIDEIGTNEPNILKRGNDRILVELPGLDDPQRIKSLLGKTANLTFRFISNENEDSFGVEKLSYENSQDEDLVSKRIILSGDNLLDAQPRMNNQTNETVVSFSLDRVGAKRFGKATSSGIGKQLAIVLDGKIISAPVIRETIASGSGQISGGFTFQSATDLALLLRSGALPAPLEIIEERTVGPDLGQDSIDAGIIALIVGFLLVIIFILIKYKTFGIITNVALIINLFLLIGILTIFEATLTLPGIAGIILTVGMAVDANVLIFERIKEELKNEKNNLIAFDSGYTKSRTAILDANITTLIAAIILFFMGSGPIKGFSVTLGVGIFTTLFSVYFIARLLTVIYVLRNKEKQGLI
jgi:protein-export membrane protein SecD